jgi:aconitate hydratase
MVPFIIKDQSQFVIDDFIFIPNIREAIMQGETAFKAYVIGQELKVLELHIDPLTEEERDIITSGSLINFHRKLFK